MLYFKGMPEGIPWSIYNLYGQLIYTGIADGNNIETWHAASLPGRGMYIVTDGKETVKLL